MPSHPGKLRAASNELEVGMIHVDNGQCGLCTHFGETHVVGIQLNQIRENHEAPETLLDECGHPKHAALHLKVTPISGCDGFEAVKMSSTQGSGVGKKVRA
jgi:hypothetical protein